MRRPARVVVNRAPRGVGTQSPGRGEGGDGTWKSAGKTAKAFRTGKGVAWGEHDACLFRGTERFFGPSYRAFLVDVWLPSLDGVVEKLKKGALVADVGCGHAVSTILM